MSSLSELQYWLLNQLSRPVRLSGDASTVAQADRYLAACGELAPIEQIEIYRRQYWLRHTASLLEDFPVLSRLLGQAEWERLVESYLNELPRSWTLRDLGAGLAAHVRQRPETPRQALCADMAALEWAFIEVFDAPFTPGIDSCRLRQLKAEDWLDVKVQLSPSLRLLRLSHPVAELRAQWRNTVTSSPSHSEQHGLGQSKPPVPSSPIATPPTTPHDLVVSRDRHLRLAWHRVQPLEAELMRTLEAEPTLVAACRTLAERHAQSDVELERHLAAWLASWARKDWISDVRR